MFFTVCATAVVGLHITGVGFLVGAADAIVGKLIAQNVSNIGVAIIFTLFCISKV
jgi:hypothetical protein